MRWYEWLLVGVIASVVFALFLAVLANHAIGQSLREIVVESEGGAIPPPAGAPVQPPAVAGLPWQTFAEVYRNFDSTPEAACKDLPDSYWVYAKHGDRMYIWFANGDKFAVAEYVQAEGTRRTLSTVYMGRIDGTGRLVVVQTIPASQLEPGASPCSYFTVKDP